MPTPPAPQHSNIPLIIVSTALVLALVALGYLVWTTGLWQSFVQGPVQEESAPQQTETSDIEADLQSVDVGADAEVEELEAQI